MKKLLFCCLISLLIISCSKDNDSFQEDGLVEDYQVTTNSQTLSSDDYLRAKYSEDYAIIEVLRAEIEGEDVKI